MQDLAPQAGYPLMNHDIIPDIHGDHDRLCRTLKALGWINTQAGWYHPEGRKVAFLGDFIDGGDTNGPVLDTVWEMISNGQATAIMGNHELNAIHYHRRDASGHWMREHDHKSSRQHESFLAEFPLASEEALAWTARFLELPLWLDLGPVRIVHACWDESAIATVSARRPDARLKPEDLSEVALDETPFATAVNCLLKGPKHPLPKGAHFHDHSGHRRHKARVRWWASGTAPRWRDLVVSIPDLREVPDIIPAAHECPRLYAADAKPVLFGHYKLAPGPGAGAANALCLDYPGHPAAFRLDKISAGTPLEDGLLLAS